MSIGPVLLVSTAMFALGVFGALSRRNAIGILVSVELMMNAVNVNFVAFSRFHGGHLGQVFALFAIALTVAEVVVGLGLVILLHRSKKDVAVDEVRALRH